MRHVWRRREEDVLMPPMRRLREAKPPRVSPDPGRGPLAGTRPRSRVPRRASRPRAAVLSDVLALGLIVVVALVDLLE